MWRQITILPLLVGMYIRAQMEYRAAFWLDRAAQFITYSSSFAAIWLLVHRFETLGGWNWAELALLFSFQLLGYSLGASVSFTQLRDLEEQVRLGTLDVLLTKPINTWAYLIFSRLNIGYVSHVILGVVLLVWALGALDIQWSLGKVAFLAAALVSSIMVTAAVMTVIGATALIWVRSNHLFSIFFGVWELTRYPLNIFPVGIQFVMLTIVPLAFTSSVPIAAFLGKPIPLLGDWGGPVTLLAGPAFVLLAIAHWRYAMGKYQGAGG